MNTRKYIILLFVLFITPIVISQQSNVLRDRSGRIPPPGIPRGATHEDAFALALKDPNIYIGVFEPASSGTIMPSGQRLRELSGYGEARLKFSPLLCVKPIKGNFVEPIIWYTILPASRGEGSPPDRNSLFIAFQGSKWIIALQRTTNEYRVGRFGKEIEKFNFINDDTFFNVLWYGYGALCLNWPEGRPEREGLKKVPESIVDDFEEIAKLMPLTQRENKDPNYIATIDKTSKALKNDLAKSIFVKITTEKEEAPQRRGPRANRN